MRYVKSIIAATFVAFVLIGMLPATTMAGSPQSVVCKALGSDASCSTTPSGGVSIDRVINATVNILSIFVGVTAVIMIIVAGMKFMTAAGDSNSISGARRTVTYAVVGLVIVALAQIIVKFVLHRITG